jgi:hypothetical protein
MKHLHDRNIIIARIRKLSQMGFYDQATPSSQAEGVAIWLGLDNLIGPDAAPCSRPIQYRHGNWQMLLPSYAG